MQYVIYHLSIILYVYAYTKVAIGLKANKIANTTNSVLFLYIIHRLLSICAIAAGALFQTLESSSQMNPCIVSLLDTTPCDQVRITSSAALNCSLQAYCHFLIQCKCMQNSFSRAARPSIYAPCAHPSVQKLLLLYLNYFTCMRISITLSPPAPAGPVYLSLPF